MFLDQKYYYLVILFQKMGKMCGRKCVGVTSGKKARTHALCTHVLKVISHAQARVRPYIARVRASTHLRNSSLVNMRQIHIFNN